MIIQACIFNVKTFLHPIRFARASRHFADFNTRNTLITHKLLKHGYQYHKLCKTFSKFYRRYYGLIPNFNIGLKSPLCQGLSKQVLNGDVVYKLKKRVGSNNFQRSLLK